MMDVNNGFCRTVWGGIRWERLTRQRMENKTYRLLLREEDTGI